MLLIEGKQLKKYYADRLVLHIPELAIYSEDRIGIVGANGAGKTTLLEILAQRQEPDSGSVNLYGKLDYFSQLDPPRDIILDEDLAARFAIPTKWQPYMSGGEQTRFKLAQLFATSIDLILADEPTSNLDVEGIEMLEQELSGYQGALMIISHDRDLLDKLCNKILEVEHGKTRLYSGNYSSYKEQKAKEISRQEFEYQQYEREKLRLENVVRELKQQAGSTRRTPKRMGNSEARLHKMGGQKAKSNLARAAKNVARRIEHLEKREKPYESAAMKLDLAAKDQLHRKIVIRGSNVCKAFGTKLIFNHANFAIYNSWKVALLGPNGSGKSTLLQMLLASDPTIEIAHGARIGYFSQDLSILDEKRSILDNVMETSIYDQSFVRVLLARLLIKGTAVDKQVKVLSGGERVKVAFAKILTQDYNFLILDEPTNYLDLDSLEVLEQALIEYPGTVLFVSHDRRFINNVAQQIMIIKEHKITTFQGSYIEYRERERSIVGQDRAEVQHEIMILENQLATLISKLSMPGKDDDVALLDKQYQEILLQLKNKRNEARLLD